jgi:spore maturation protein CgeB
MRILVIDMKGCAYPDIGYQIKTALESMGHEVRAFNYRKWKLQHAKPTNWLLNKMMVRAATSWPAELVLVSKGETILPGTINAIKKAGIKTVNWEPDEPFGEIQAFNKLLNIPEYDAFFIYDPMYLPKLKELNPNTHHLPAAADPLGVHKEQIPLHERTFPADIGMVGSAYKLRVELMEKLRDKKLSIAGPGWEKTEFAKIALPPVSITGMVKLFNEAKINLNPHGPGLMVPNPRTFEIPASRSFELVNYRKEFHDFFVDGKEIVMYHDEKDFREKVEYYLTHDEERNKIAQAGYDRVMKEHTMRHRLETLLKTMKL